ncbi:MAG: hypothetical protein KAY32_09685 [Candidatus Eisenbacteria sp.]|nr:hypothetical protein [Candidatus Eisenbacteria bacterium]
MNEISERPGTRKTRRERFLSVAERRTVHILKQLQLLGNCSNRASYEYEQTDVAKIFDAIDEELRRTKTRFASKRGIDFRLRE